MKVSIVYLGLFLSENGFSAPSRRVRDIARGLAAHGHEVFIFVPRRTKNEFDVVLDGFEVCYLGKYERGRVWGRLLFWSELISLVKKKRIDWALFYYNRIDAYFVYKILRQAAVKIGTILSDKHSANYSLATPRKWMLGVSLKLGEIYLAKESDLNICISRLLVKDCDRYAPNVKKIVLPVLVDSEVFIPSTEFSDRCTKKWGVAEHTILICYLGGLWKHHGVANLLEAYAKIHHLFPNSSLLIAGQLVQASTHDDVHEISSALGIKDNVIITGWLETDDVVNIYSRADILVISQHSTEGINAGFPTKIAEYAQMGKAIIATDTSDISLYFKDKCNAIIIPPEDPSAFSKGLALLIADKKLRAKLGRNAAKMARDKFDFKIACKELSDTLTSL